MLTLTSVWQGQLKKLLADGRVVSPRGQRTVELPQSTVSFDMMHPVVLVKERKLHVPFLGGEAYWIVSGDDTVAGIENYNKHIVQFSDDGQKFFGAYGPKIVAQLPYIVAKLREDPASRQAGLTIWRESPPKTRDVPCTISMFFNIREDRLHAHVFMRSSDAWLGLPYDAFNFTMVACAILKELNKDRLPGVLLKPGIQYLTMVSSHLYEQHWGSAELAMTERVSMDFELPPKYYDTDHDLLEVLDELRNSKKGDSARWFDMGNVDVAA